MCWIRAGESCVRVEGTVLNTLKGAGMRKSGWETKLLKRWRAGSRGGFLKKGDGAGTPLQIMHRFLANVEVFNVRYFLLESASKRKLNFLRGEINMENNILPAFISSKL